jgi:transposase
VLTDAAGLPLAVATSAANTHDSLALIPLGQAIPAIRSRRGPRRRRPAKLHADKGYDYPHLRAWLRARRITPRIARRGVETSTRLGRHRWVIERTFAWLTGYRRLTLRYERCARLFTALRFSHQDSPSTNGQEWPLCRSAPRVGRAPSASWGEPVPRSRAGSP